MSRKSDLRTHAIVVSSVWLGLAGSACGEGADEGPRDVAAVALTAMQKPVADNRPASELFAQVELEALLATDKIRRGTVIDYDHNAGNGIVFIVGELAPGVPSV